MKNKNGLVAFALLGLAAGAAAYYLLSTEDGKKQLDKANSSIKSLTKSLKELSKKEAQKAERFAKSAKEDLDALKSRAKGAGKAVANKVADTTTEWAHKAADAATKLANKTEEIAAKTKSDISNS